MGGDIGQVLGLAGSAPDRYSVHEAAGAVPAVGIIDALPQAGMPEDLLAVGTMEIQVLYSI